jgi:hypothetical protein
MATGDTDTESANQQEGITHGGQKRRALPIKGTRKTGAEGQNGTVGRERVGTGKEQETERPGGQGNVCTERETNLARGLGEKGRGGGDRCSKDVAERGGERRYTPEPNQDQGRAPRAGMRVTASPSCQLSSKS